MMRASGWIRSGMCCLPIKDWQLLICQNPGNNQCNRRLGVMYYVLMVKSIIIRSYDPNLMLVARHPAGAGTQIPKQSLP